MHQTIIHKSNRLPMLGLGLCIVIATGCQHQPPAQRPAVTLPVYSQGDADNGKKQYEEACLKCHKLQLGYGSTS